MRVDLFDFDLPPERIALRPAVPRNSSRMLVVDPQARPPFDDRMIRDLPGLLRPGDLLIINDTRVIPARLFGHRKRGAADAKIEILLHLREGDHLWRAFARPAKKLKAGDTIVFANEAGASLEAEVRGEHQDGEILLAFTASGDALDAQIEILGQMPLPPYIAGKRPTDAQDLQDYQPLFARHKGAVAAPTASLHFTPELVAAIEAQGATFASVTLHVGAGTFLPVKATDTDAHRMHAEWGLVSEATAAAINAARTAGGRIVAIGTTPLRLLEIRSAERWNDATLFGRDRYFHHARLSLQRSGSAAHQFPSAEIDTLHAGLGLLRARCDAPGLCACDRSGLSLLQLWRCLPSSSSHRAGLR